MNRIIQYIKLIFHGHYDTSNSDGRSLERSRNIALTAITAMLAKIIATIVPLVTVRLTLSYLGEEVYGLWSAVTSFFTMFAFADLGLGSGLQTELSRASAMEDDTVCKKLVSSTYIMLLGVSSVLTVGFLLIFPFVDWAELVNAETKKTIGLAGGVVLAIVIARFINIPLALIQRTQMAMQEGYRSNLWQCSGNVFSLVFVILITVFNLGELTMIWASSMIVVIVALLNMIVYFKFQRPNLCPKIKYFDKTLSRKLLSTGITFFVLSIFTSISLSIDNFIVAKVCSLPEVTPYSVMYKIVSLIAVVSAMLSTPMWSANGEALKRGEYKWVKSSTKRVMLISLALSVAASVGVFLLIKPAMYILSDNTLVPDYMLLLPMCIMQIVISVTNPYFMVLNAGRIVKFQIITYFIYAAVTLPLKFVLGNRFGVIALSWVGVLAYIILLTIPTVYKALKYIKDESVRRAVAD